MDDFSCSEKTSNLVKAYAEFQALGLVAKKSGVNPAFKSAKHQDGAPYITIEDALAPEIMKALSERGLALFMFPLGGLEVGRLHCRLSHITGEYFQWICACPLSNKTPQGVVSATTYLRRGNAVSGLGLVDSNDDDGNHASTAPEQTGVSGSNNDYTDTQKPKSPVQKAPPPPYEQGRQAAQQKQYAATPGKAISDKQLKFLFVKMKQSGFSDIEVGEYITKRFGVHGKNELDQPQFNQLLEALADRNLDWQSPEAYSDNNRFDEMNVPF